MWTQLSVGRTDYFLQVKGCRVLGYSHERARDIWRSLPEGPRQKSGACELFAAFAHGASLYTVFERSDGEQVALSVFDTGTRAWQALPWPIGATRGRVTGLDVGILFSRIRTDSSLPLEYSFFEYSTRRWRQGSVDLGVANTGEDVEAVTVAGRSLALFTVWPLFDRPGTLTITTFDPLRSQVVVQTSKEFSVDALQAAQGNLQVAAPGIAYIGPWKQSSAATEGTLLDLRTGDWSTLQLRVQTDDARSSADWVFDFYGNEAASFVVANEFLYEPSTQLWFAVPDDGVTPPDRKAVDDDESFTRAGPQQRCSMLDAHPCWALDVGSLAETMRPL
jgi:hypothetical protein